MPNPAPWSGNANVVEIWKGNNVSNARSDSAMVQDFNMAQAQRTQEVTPVAEVAPAEEKKADENFVTPELGEVKKPLVDIVDAPSTSSEEVKVPLAGSDEKEEEKETELPVEEPVVTPVEETEDGKVEVPATESGVPLVDIAGVDVTPVVKDEEKTDTVQPLADIDLEEPTQEVSDSFELPSIDVNTAISTDEAPAEEKPAEEATPVAEVTSSEEKPVEEPSPIAEVAPAEEKPAENTDQNLTLLGDDTESSFDPVDFS